MKAILGIVTFVGGAVTLLYFIETSRVASQRDGWKKMSDEYSAELRHCNKKVEILEYKLK